MTVFSLFLNWNRKNNVQTSISKVKVTFISLFLGILFGFVIISLLGHNPFKVFSQLFKKSFRDASTINTLLIFTSIYTLSGLANAFAFKTGLFNIGVPGQMIAGGSTSMLIALTSFRHIPSYVVVPLLIIIAILVSASVGLLVGFLKSQFNVHEVVSTILLNWIIFYLFKYIFRPEQSFVDAAGNSKYIRRSIYLGGSTDNAWIASIVIALSLCFLIFVLLKFTTFGRRIKMTGLNKNASKYFGINTKLATIISLGISAGIAGLLGYVYYFGKQHFVGALTTTLPTIGFDGIAIALLAFNSPLVIPLISLLYAVFQTGSDGTSLPSSLQNPTIMLIFSIMIYFAAISTLFMRFKPIKFVRLLASIKHSNKAKEILTNTKELDDKIKQDIKDKKNILLRKIEDIKTQNKQKQISNKKIKELKKDFYRIRHDEKMEIRLLWSNSIKEICKILDQKYDEFIDVNYKLTKFYILEITRNKYLNKLNNFLLQEYSKKEINKDQIKNKKQELKTQYKKTLKENIQKLVELRKNKNKFTKKDLATAIDNKILKLEGESVC